MDTDPVRTLFGKIWNALLTAIVVTLLAALFVAAMPPVYQAKATVRGSADDMLLIQSAEILELVSRTTKVRILRLRGWFEQLLEAGGDLDKITLLQQKLTVSRGQQSDWIDIIIEAQDPNVAAVLADEIAAAYSKKRSRSTLQTQERALAQQQAASLEMDLLRHLESDARLLNFAAASRALKNDMRQRDQKFDAIDKEIVRLSREKEAAAVGDTGALTEPGVVRSVERVVKVKMEQSALAMRYGPGHQKSTLMEARLSQANVELKDELNAFLQRVDQRIDVYLKNRMTFEKEKAALASQLMALERSQVEREGLRLRHDTALATLQGFTDDSVVQAFAKAVPPRNTFGSNQLLLLLSIFSSSFLFILVLLVFIAPILPSSAASSPVLLAPLSKKGDPH